MNTAMTTNVQADSVQQAKGVVSNGVDKRGWTIYNIAELLSLSGKTKEGKWLTQNYQPEIFTLSVYDRQRIVERCSPVLGVVSSRQNRISAMDWDIVPKNKEEDRIVSELKSYYSVFKEYVQEDAIQYKVVAYRMFYKMKQVLPDLLPDAKNFSSSLVRWSRSIKMGKQSVAEEIEEWLQHLNAQDTWEDYLKKYVFDLLVHGATSNYKTMDEASNRLSSVTILPGGSVIPLRTATVSPITMYAQVMPGLEPQFFFTNEIVYSNYLPVSAKSYGIVPLEALVNKIAESLLFDELMAEQADGTKPPNKAVIFGGNSPFGNEGAEFDREIPLDDAEQARAEEKLNTARKNAIVTLTGMGTPMVLDLTRENTMSVQMERQKMIREEVALVFNMSNLEINQTNGDGVSGRNTSESLETIDQNKGVIPIVRTIEKDFNYGILPFRYGNGYLLKARVGIDEEAELDMNIKKVQSGLYSVNEIRTNELGEDPFDGDEFEKPQNAQQQQPDGTEMNPLNMRQV
jgi:hypothetical protein